MVARIVLLLLALCLSGLKAADFSIYPQPAGLTRTNGSLALEDAVIVTSGGPREELSALAGQLSQELADRCRLALVCREGRPGDQTGPAVVIGLAADPQIARLLAASPEGPALDWRVPEGYRLSVTPRGAVIAGHDLRGLFYGIQSFLQLAGPTGGVACAEVADRPLKSFRGVHVYLPARDQLPFFRNYLRTMAHFKINTLILEVGGGMRLDRHPEVNLAWERFCRAFYDLGDPMLRYGEQVPLGPQSRFQASVHTELAGGGWLTKAEVRELVEFARAHGMEVVPEIQSLTHAYYLTIAHRDLAEIPEAEWPDSYDPANPKARELLYEVMEEYLEVIRPSRVHIGHDEWRAGVRGNTGELFARDVIEITRWLRARGIGTMMWADHLVRGHNMEPHEPGEPANSKVWYAFPSTEGAAELIAAETKEILMLNWSWAFVPTSFDQLAGHGFRQVLGNFDGARQYGLMPELLAREDILGAEMSTWCAADEFSFGQNGAILNMLLSNNLLWSGQYPPLEELSAHLASRMPEVRRLLSGNALPSLDLLRGREGYSFVTVSLAGRGGIGRSISDSLSLAGAPAGRIESEGLPFELAGGERPFLGVRKAGESVAGIPVDRSAASLLLLHGSVGRGVNVNTYTSNYREDTAELLGWYRITWEDGLETSVPISYGRNISGLGGGYGDQVYFAHTVKLGEDAQGRPLLAQALEWVNPRPNRRVRSVDLVGADAASGAWPLLLGVTVVEPPFTR